MTLRDEEEKRCRKREAEQQRRQAQRQAAQAERDRVINAGRILNNQEAAAYCGISTWTLDRRRKAGDFPESRELSPSPHRLEDRRPG